MVIAPSVGFPGALRSVIIAYLIILTIITIIHFSEAKVLWDK